MEKLGKRIQQTVRASEKNKTSELVAATLAAFEEHEEIESCLPVTAFSTAICAGPMYAGGPNHDVLSQHNIRFGKTFEKTIVNHRPSALRTEKNPAQRKEFPSAANLSSYWRFNMVHGKGMLWTHI
jgi:hypothetical protein